MTASSVAKRKTTSRPFILIGLIAIALAAALTGVWYHLANRLDTAVREAIEAAAGGGTTIACDGQEVFGYPFRIGLRCGAVSVNAPSKGIGASTGALRTAAQIYEPAKIVAEVDGPLLLAAPGLAPLDIRWTLFQASTHFWTSGVDRMAVVIEGPDVALAQPGATRRTVLRSDHLELHARRRDDDLDFALDDRGIRALQPDLQDLPVFDLAADLTIAGAADWLSGSRPGDTIGEALRGRSGTIRSLSLGMAEPGSGRAEVSGPFEVDEEGRISGRFDIALTDPAAIAGLAGRLIPGAQGVAGTIASGIGLIGRTEAGRTVITVDVKRGKASLGFISLGRIPPLE